MRTATGSELEMTHILHTTFNGSGPIRIFSELGKLCPTSGQNCNQYGVLQPEIDMKQRISQHVNTTSIMFPWSRVQVTQ